jgi:hypothetical protein
MHDTQETPPDLGSSRHSRDIIRLTHGDGLKCVVTPESQDRYVIKIDQLLQRAEAGANREVLESQLRILFQELAGWLSTHGEDVKRAVATVSAEGTQFVLLREGEYDSEFEYKLSDLEHQIAQDPGLGMLRYFETMALHGKPDESFECFIGPGMLTVEFSREQ